jgi:hypothetical protein
LKRVGNLDPEDFFQLVGNREVARTRLAEGELNRDKKEFVCCESSQQLEQSFRLGQILRHGTELQTKVKTPQ